jgi:uncharacterized membrane protein
MNSKLIIPAIWTLAGALVIKLWTAWSQLPDRVAVHFGISMQPNGWSSKGTLAATMLLAVVGQASLATWLIFRISSVSGMIAVIQLVVSAVLVSAFWQVINFNTRGTPFQAMWVLLPMVLLFATITVFLLNLVFRYSRG